MRHFVAINIQYVKNDKIEIKNLTIIDMSEQATEKNIAICIIEIIIEYNLNFKKLLAVTVDNGHNMLSCVDRLNGFNNVCNCFLEKIAAISAQLLLFT